MIFRIKSGVCPNDFRNKQLKQPKTTTRGGIPFATDVLTEENLSGRFGHSMRKENARALVGIETRAQRSSRTRYGR